MIGGWGARGGESRQKPGRCKRYPRKVTLEKAKKVIAARSVVAAVAAVATACGRPTGQDGLKTI